MTVASEQNATTGAPLIVPVAASMPLSSSGLIRSTEPSSRSAASRNTGFRGSCSRGSFGLRAGAAWAGGAAATGVVVKQTSRGGRPSGAAEGDGDVVAAEAEGVVHRRHVALRQLAPGGRDVETDVLGVVEVGRRRHDAVVQRQHGGQRLQ